MHHPARFENFCLSVIKGGIFVIMFLPLLIINHALFPFIFPRTIAFRVIVEICCALYIILAYVHPKYRVQRSPLVVTGGAFLAIMIISSLLGVNWHHSFWSTFERSEGIVTWLHLAGFIIIVLGILKTKKEWLSILKLTVLAGFVQEIYSLGEFFNAKFALDIGGSRVAGAVGNASFLAAYLLIIILLAAYLYRYELKHYLKLYYCIVIGAGLFVIWQTQTRGALLALIVGGVFFVTVWLLQSQKRIALIGIPFILIALLGAYGMLVVNRDTPLVRNNLMLARVASISPTDITTQNRILVWAAGFEAFKSRFLLGWGWENFNVAFNRYFDPRITRDIGSNPWYDRAHNILVEVGVASGILGLIAYLTLFGWALYAVWPKKHRETDAIGHLILATLLVVYFVQNLFVFDTLNSLILFALVLAFIQFSEKKENTKKYELPKRLAPAVSLITLFLLVVALYFWNMRPALANYYTLRAVSFDKSNTTAALTDFQKAIQNSSPADEETHYALVQYARQRVQSDGDTPEARKLVTAAAAALSQSIHDNPLNIQMYLLLSELYLAADRFDPSYIGKAETIALNALERAPRRYQVYTLLGRLEIEQGNFPQGTIYLQQATELNPDFAEGYWNLAIANILQGNTAEATALLAHAEGLGFDIYRSENIDRLVKAYVDSKNIDATIAFFEKLATKFPDNKLYQETLDSLKQTKKDIEARR